MTDRLVIHAPDWLDQQARERAWDEGTKAIIMRREARRIIHDEATWPYWQLVGSDVPNAAWLPVLAEQLRILRQPLIFDEVHVWPKGAVLDAKISELLALRDIAKDKAAGITGYIIHPSAFDKIEGRFLQPRTFTRSRGRRLLEWAARWLGYYVR